MNLYDVKGYDAPLLLSDEHAESIGATRHPVIDQPAQNASRGDWLDYAVSQGGDPAGLEEATRGELIERYSTP